ncbi:MAG: sigma-70 family RNA polymerase sigma factor, partial [Phycisphaerales bacterium]|nr:sigma-70 family RNA polymerase sigma factor [Phycisphaerales bacterium]
MLNDWELLHKFTREKDQGVFKELVERHIDMVHGVARRMLGASRSHADDAVQAVFLLLSQRADRISPKGSLAGWLFRATRYCCANIKKSEDRRQRHERESVMEPKEDATTNEELAAVLDEALGRLSEKERQAILVRYMKRKSVAETSEVLGVSVRAVEKRLRLGIEKIRHVFARKGFVVPTAAVGAVMMVEGAKAAPASLTASAVGATIQASASVAGIAKGALAMMKLAVAKTIAVAAMVAAIVAIAVTVPLLSKAQGEPAAPPPPALTKEILAMTDKSAPVRALLTGKELYIGRKAPYPENVATSAAFRAMAQYLNIDLPISRKGWSDYCYFTGITGEAFRFHEFMSIVKDAGGQSTAERYAHRSNTQVLQDAFTAAGLTCEIHMKSDPNFPSQDELYKKIIASIHGRSMPVVGFGGFAKVRAPFLITGYDNHAVLGWSHFQNEDADNRHLQLKSEPTGEFRLENWYDAIDGIAFATGKKEEPPLRDIYLPALQRAV